MRRFWELRFLIIIILVFGGWGGVNATEYFISPDGDDLRDGQSQLNAWKSIEKANQTDFKPGDRLLFRGDATYRGNLVFSAADAGSESDPVTISSFGKGRALIDSGDEAAMQFTNCAGIVIENINMKGSGWRSNHSSGINFYIETNVAVKLHFIRLRSLDISGFGRDGITMGSDDMSNPGFENVEVSNLEAHDNQLAGMTTWAYHGSNATTWAHENFKISNSRFHHNPGDPDKKDNHSGSGLILGQVSHALVEYCEAFENGENCNHKGGGPVGLWAYESNDVTFQYNESHHNHTGAISRDGGGFDLDGGIVNSRLQYNYSHDNDGPGYLLFQYQGARSFSNNVVRFNISENDGRLHGYGGIHVGAWKSRIDSSDIYHNTIYLGGVREVGSAVVRVQRRGLQGIRFFNNLFISEAGLPFLNCDETNGVSFIANGYYSMGQSLTNLHSIAWCNKHYITVADWSQEAHQEKDSAGNFRAITASPLLKEPGHAGKLGKIFNPSFLQGYTIPPDSPVIDHGVSLEGIVTQPLPSMDFFGGRYPSGASPDLGVCEFPKR